ncbi:hypothetical protein KWI12_19730 [Citrobacter cronae]|uniref:hypothetical protein n=1 Tax=Citrobacter cronae TaxID=1748967 RepID=UPI0021CF4574|nr:hypothetical protein [Citrobacter cronae]MCU6199089.1 hypothetical protein [Citrobacter cronae]
MKERGMIFNAEMVNAILSGRKTQTRRPIKWKQTRFTEIGEREDGSNWPWSEDTEKVCDYWHPCPFGAVGDRIWVRETWAEAGASAPDLTLYRANYPEHVPAQYENVPPVDEILWTPSIFMPRWASRILLEITDVRVEHLNNISECDAKAEGGPTECTLIGDKYFPGFRSLWKSIYGEQSWAANPWVWVIKFNLIGNEAAQ